MKVDVISDAHSSLRPEAVAALQGCERIIRAGDSRAFAKTDPDALGNEVLIQKPSGQGAQSISVC